MFVRAKPIGKYRYLQLVKNHREGRRTVQDVVCTLGRLDKLEASGGVDALVRSLARFGQGVRVAEAKETRSQPNGVRGLERDLALGRDPQPGPGSGSSAVGLAPPMMTNITEASRLNESKESLLSNEAKKAEVLGKSLIFSGLNREHLTELCHLVLDHSVGARQFLFLEGDPSESCYLIASGMIKMLKHSFSGTNLITGIYGPGEMLSHILLFRTRIHSSSAQAMVDSTVLAIRHDDFVSFLYRQPGVGIEIIARMLNVASQRHQAATVRLIDLAAERADCRLARVLLALSVKFGPSIALSRTEIAEMAGTTSETAARFVSRLRQRGVVKSFRGRVIVLDENALQSVAQMP